MRLRLSLLLLLLTVAVHAAPAASPTPEPMITAAPHAKGDTLIVPGVRVGPAILGDPLPSLLQKAGKGHAVSQGPYTNVIYEQFFVVVAATGKRAVAAVVVNDPAYKLKNGLGIGSDQDQVEKVLGKPPVAKPMAKETMGMIDHSVTYPALGLAINYNKSRKVVQMAISAPRK